MHMFYEPEDDVRMFSGDCFVGKPSQNGSYTLGGRCPKSKHTVIRPISRGNHFVVGRPTHTKYAQFLLGRPPVKDMEDAERGVYVLQKPDGMIYVGKSQHIQERLRQHSEGQGASCAKGKFRRLPPLTQPCEDLEAWERSEVLARMRKHGIQKVRGWMYTTQEISEAEREHAFRQVCERFDLCRRCGLKGHFISRCNAVEVQQPAWAVS
jgi:hypothetical protein